MENFDHKKHWEDVYQTKQLTEVSWYQPTPKISLEFVKQTNLALDAQIIDIGGGDSFFVDHLLELGYTNVSVLDISEAALNRAKERLGNKAPQVTWIVSDASDFKPTEIYDFWHDRAAFHFLTDDERISKYVSIISNSIRKDGKLVIGTFSENGPKKCSGLEICQYSEAAMYEKFKASFERIECITEDHPTPFNTMQNFLFCSFKKR